MKREYEVIGKVSLGKNVVIEKGAVLYGPLTIGDNTYIGRNVIIGYPAFDALKHIIEKHGSKLVWNDSKTVIGEDAIIYPGAVIYSGVILGRNIRVFHNALIREEVKIGDNCMIGTNSVLDGYITIGKNTLIHSQAYICSKTIIGNQVFIGPQVGTINEKTAQSRIGLPSIENYRDIENGPTIEDEVSIGEGAKIMANIKIGKRAIVGAGSVVTRDIPQNEIWVGNPARKLKNRDF